MAYGVGMHATDSKLVLVALEQSHGSMVLSRFHHIERPNSSRDELIREAGKVLATTEWPKEPVVLAIPASQSFIRQETLSIKGRLADLRQAVRLRLRDGLPCDPEELQYGEVKLTDTEQGVVFLAAGCRKDILHQYLSTCQAHDIDVISACLDSQLLWHTYRRCLHDSSDENAMLLWHDDETLNVVISNQGSPLVIRAINLAGIRFDQLSDRILLEINRTQYSQTELTDTLVIRYVDDSPALKAALDRLQVGDVKPLAWMPAVKHELSAEDRDRFDRSAGVALGAALKALGSDSQVIDFRHGAFAHQGIAQRLRKHLMAAAITLCLLSATILTGQLSAREQVLSSLEQVAAERSRIWRDLYPDRSVPVNMQRTLSSELTRYEEMARANVNIAHQASALDLLKSLAQNLPDEKTGAFTIDDLRIAQDGIQFRGQTISFARVDQIAAALRGMPNVTVRPEEMRVPERGNGEGEVSFRMKIERKADETSSVRLP